MSNPVLQKHGVSTVNFTYQSTDGIDCGSVIVDTDTDNFLLKVTPPGFSVVSCVITVSVQYPNSGMDVDFLVRGTHSWRTIDSATNLERNTASPIVGESY